MSALDLAALLELCDAATPGPWTQGSIFEQGVYTSDERDSVATTRSIEDATFIAAAREALPALITRLRAAEARTAWQPIETAPRDGTLVLAWHPHWGGPDAVRCSSRGQWTADWLPTCAPTHWQPLPAAPEAP